MRPLFIALCIACMAMLPPAMGSSSNPGQRIETVRFASGSSSTAIKGRLKGSPFTDYVFRAGAGQSLEVSLKRSNPQNYFNIIAPGAGDEALYVGQTGEGYKGVLPDDGDYTVRVYLMRPAARRNETSNYTLTISLTGTPRSPIPASKDALVPGTRFHASAKIPCKPPFGNNAVECEAFVVRRGFDGTATVEVRLPIGSPRHILFVKETPVASDGQGALTFTRNRDVTIVRVGEDERYDIPDAFIIGD